MNKQLNIIELGDMPTYNEITAEITNMTPTHPAYSAKLDLLAEYGEINHLYCKRIMGFLNDWTYDYDKDCGEEYYEAPPLDEARVRTLGGFIHERGGLFTLQMNFYTMLHFHAKDLPTKRKVQQLTHIFNGVGDWVH